MKLPVNFIEDDFDLNTMPPAIWEKVEDIVTTKYWSGEEAPVDRHFKTRLLWSKNAFYVRFVATQNEPLNISFPPNLRSKTIGLWERDVCEIFIAPNADEPNRYYEFEVSPLGEWLDAEIHQTADNRETNFNYFSGLQAIARIQKGIFGGAIKIGWEAFGKAPKNGEIWKGNLFRCVGKDETRGYLAWSPTMTETPNFHVPEKFGEFEFV